MNVFVFIICLIGMGMFFIYTMANIGVKRRDERYNPEDTQLIQVMNRNLEKMERRIETLETLLIEKADLQEPPTYRDVMQKQEKTDRY